MRFQSSYVIVIDLTCNGTTRDSARLVGGSSPAVGRLELCNTAKFRREVCDDGWDDNDARVVCRELGLLQPGVGIGFECALAIYTMSCRWVKL